jgi:Na+-driven multidrug efflux pump
MFMGFYGVAVATPISWLISALALIIISIIYIFKKLPNEDAIIRNVESED